jgi:iron complex outermembrane receptor protein
VGLNVSPFSFSLLFMFNKFMLALALLLLPVSLFAQFLLSGEVIDASSQRPLPGATVALAAGGAGTTTDEQGSFSLPNLPAGSHTLRVSYIGYEPQVQTVQLSGPQRLRFTLQRSPVLADEVIVSATRATQRTGTTYTNVTRQEIQDRNFGQDIPFLLNQVPSVVVDSDAGTGIGYTGIRIRGSDITRINVTVNGIPINDAESHGAFFVNMPDLASSIQDIQVQRGVGTSTNGAAAFGASLNLRTLDLNPKAYAETNHSFGSFNTLKNNVMFGTGLINGKFAVDGRVSRITSDGYIDRAWSNLKSYYLSAGYYGQTGMLKFVTFSGQERTYQAWNGVAEELLETNRTFNSAGTDNGKRENPYDTETDNYQQDHYQLHYAKQLGEAWNLTGALHYTYGRGYYEQYKVRARFADYRLTPIQIGGETINRTDLIRRRWLDNDFYGLTYALQYSPGQRFTATLGGGWNQYDGQHFGEIIWARYASGSEIRDRYYENDALKTDFNVFAKSTLQVSDRLSLFGDLQYRHIAYTFQGFNDQVTSPRQEQQEVQYDFFNPKAGLTYGLGRGQSVYASFAVGNREPVRRDFTDSSPGSRPQHETLRNLEAGYRLAPHGVRLLGLAGTLNLELNYFLMNYRNQLVLTGQINDVGGYTRTNIPESYRTGVELSGGLALGRFLTFSHSLTLSRNKITRFSEFIDDYDTGEQRVNAFESTDIAFSPSVISATQAEVQPLKGLRAALILKTVSDQFLDNTSSASRMIDGYQVTDLRVRYGLQPVPWMKELEVGLLVNNVFNRMYEANGYTFSYISDQQLVTENFFYPQAPRNFLISLSLRF